MQKQSQELQLVDLSLFCHLYIKIQYTNCCKLNIVQYGDGENVSVLTAPIERDNKIKKN